MDIQHMNEKALNDLLKRYQTEKQWAEIVKMFSAFTCAEIINTFQRTTISIYGFSLGKYFDYVKKSAEGASRRRQYLAANQSLKECYDTIQRYHELFDSATVAFGFDKQVFASYAYFNYLFCTAGTKRALEKMAVGTGFSGYIGKTVPQFKLAQKAATEILEKATKTARSLYEKILSEDPKDIKNQYRYAKILISCYEKYDNSKQRYAFPQKERIKFYEEAVGLFKSIKENYELLSDENKKRVRNIHIKARYNLAKVLNDNIDAMIPELAMFGFVYNHDDIKLATYNFPWNPAELKTAADEIVFIFNAYHIPFENLSEENAKRIAAEYLPVHIFDLFYRRAKIFYTMYKIYAAGILRVTNEKRLEKMENYLMQALMNCKYVADIKIEALSQKTADQGGFVHELVLLGELFQILRKPKDFEIFVDRYKAAGKHKNKSFTGKIEECYNYYQAIAYIYNKATRDTKKAMSFLEPLAKGGNPIYKNKAKKLVAIITNEKLFA